LEQVGRGNDTARFELSLTLNEGNQGLSGGLSYDLNLFEAETIRRLVGHFENLLAGAAADPNRSVWELPLLSEAERGQIVKEWNRTAQSYGSSLIHELFECQANRRAEVVALIDEDRQLTYGELNRRANQLAFHLMGLGVGPEVCVGIYLKRSVELIIGVLGTLKAGGAYLPLGLESPPERLSRMLEEAGAGVVLSEQELEGRLPVFLGQIVLLDAEWERISQESESEPESEALAENPAYVIYTSGSTGKPKGVVVTHRGLSNYLLWCREAYELEEGAGAPLHSSLSFDLTVTSLLGPLVSGASIDLLDEEGGLGELSQRLSA
jgi:non-ribosomal peptide synthetase component F